MKDTEKKRWFEVCGQITKEEDHDKFQSLLAELNKLLDDEEMELRGGKPVNSEASQKTWLNSGPIRGHR
ncbi:MAG TPA: hypothetical protein VFF50_10665 [Candidatus Deferrimicrobiaceae bacterium]|nr:hypothetical protein [Candidatus Deferrimicrobiaceae bacterium]